MWKLLRTPRWGLATLVVVAICGLFVSLGQWQLRRHAERALENTIVANRLAGEPAELSTLLAAAGSDADSLDHRPVSVTGTFDPDREILVRSQVSNERPGFHVVTPLLSDVGTVLVNRGWVPLAVESPPVAAVPPPEGAATIEGLVRTSQSRPPIGPTEPEGVLTIVSRIDLDRLDRQFDDLAPVWVQQLRPAADTLPVPLDVPDTDDPGPHLPYAIQWFSFAVIGAVGYGLLVRKALRTSR